MHKTKPVKRAIKRRQYSSTFKAKIVAACDHPGASVAGVALAHGINANLIHRWRQLAKDKDTPVSTQADFLPVPLPIEVSDTPVSVIIEIKGVKLHWPLSHIDQSIAWLRALQA